MLKGFTVPKSPFGQAALTPPPPWHYAGDVVAVEFWTDADAAAATLPKGLSPDPKSGGHAVMMFQDWRFTAQDDEYLDPARYQYREALMLVDATYATCQSCGVRTSTSTMTPRLRSKTGLSFLSRPTVLLRYFPRLAAGYRDKPAVNELAKSITDNLNVVGAWVGKGELNFPEANGEELRALAPYRIVSGFRYSLSYSVSDLKILEDHNS
jgi:hypothetical protein